MLTKATYYIQNNKVCKEFSLCVKKPCIKIIYFFKVKICFIQKEV